MGDNILVKIEAEKQEGGIILPDEQKKVKLFIAEVPAGSKYKKGMEIIISGDAKMSKLIRDEKEYYLIKENDIVAIEI